MAKIRETVKSGNCQVCGIERFSYQIRPTKIGHFVLDACNLCASSTEVYKEFKKAADIINELAQDGSLSSPMIVVEPFNDVLKDATDILRVRQPSYFVGVGKIKAGPSSWYGHVSSQDHTSLNVNIQRILNQSGGNIKSLDSIFAAVGTIAHERAHSKDFVAEQGKFAHGEDVAEAEEKSAIDWLKNNMDNPAVSNILKKYNG